jgi:enamine deaminase RidA (YjgF/YER057c/UK114 family)
VAENQTIDPQWKKYGNNPELTYAPAVRRGNLLFISGLTGVDPETGKLASATDIVEQMRQIYRNIADILKAAGATPKNVVQTTDYITTRENYKNTALIRREFFGDSLPASVGVVVKELLRKDALVEVSVIAVLD